MFKKYIILLVIPMLVLSVIMGCTSKGPRPENFKYEKLDFTVHKPNEYRTTLSNGLVVYIAEDNEIPWFNASLMVKTGPFLEPTNKIGVEGLVSSIMRSGGSTTMNGEQINERMDFLAGNVSATSLSINMKYVDEGLKIWMDILTNPAFPDDKLRREKESALNRIKNRNNNVSSVASRVFDELIYGEKSPITAQQTEAIVNGITRTDLVTWHKKYWGANNAILVVSGDFKKDEMLKKLETCFGKWKNAEKAVPKIPEVKQETGAGVYLVQPIVIPNQGVIRIGHIGLKQDDPDYPAVDLMNYILGSGSFSSRITRTVRSDYGLAYSTSSSFSGGTYYPGTFSASCQTKNSTVVFATQLMLNEIEKIRTEPVSKEDLQFAKTARVNAFPSMFSSISAILSNFARLEFNGRPMDYYDTYLEKYEKITLEDIHRVAQKYLIPDKMIILISGNIKECSAGADKLLPNQNAIDAMAAQFGGRTIDELAKKYGDGKVHVIPLK